MNNYLKFSAITVSTVLSIYSIIIITMTPHGYKYTHSYNSFLYSKIQIISNEIDFSFFLATFGLIISIILITLKKRIWKHFFAFVLLLAFTPLIQFWSNNYYFGLGFFKIEIISFFLLTLHLIYNTEVMIDVKKILRIDENIALENRKLDESNIEIFRIRFRDLNRSELEIIINGNKHVEEAKEAAAQILDNRK